uniref:Uncharacterized protein n=1 Tax=Populus trichocarpa TaxID=3694 RepID=A0A3N7EY79_POPTR
MTFFLVFLLQVFQFPHQNNNPVLHKCLNFYHFFSLSLNSQGILSTSFFTFYPYLSLSHAHSVQSQNYSLTKRERTKAQFSLSPYTLLCPHSSPFF